MVPPNSLGLQPTLTPPLPPATSPPPNNLPPVRHPPKPPHHSTPNSEHKGEQEKKKRKEQKAQTPPKGAGKGTRRSHHAALEAAHGLTCAQERHPPATENSKDRGTICILHDWSDDHCIKLLKNCHKASPENGKVIAVDSILLVAAETSSYAKQAFHVDLFMLAFNPGGKERTEEEFKDLAKATGFAGGVKPICCVNVLPEMISLFPKRPHQK
ncbi:hypothetical protein SUGI_1183740 [Cryptomeria japonica]|nr:hypothetical protein SUGI_1183740 [Cryptomeria japonica]